MVVFSPSQTKNFLQCPMKWKLYREGWLPRKYNKGNLYAIRGTAVSAGLDAHNKGADAEEAHGEVDRSMYVEWGRARIDEREWAEFKSAPPVFEELTLQANMLVQTYIENPPVAFTVLHSEYIFENHGNARADVIAKLGNGRIIPVDYKCKDVPIANFYQFTIKQDYKYDWQLMHYCWAVSEEFSVECLEFGIVVLWYDKKPRIEYVPFSVNPERLANWYISARDVWARMEACKEGRADITEVAEHKTKFGPCEYMAACLEHNRDEDLMLRDYIYNPRS